MKRERLVSRAFIAGGRTALVEAANAAYKEAQRARKHGDDDAEYWAQVGDFIQGFLSGSDWSGK